VIDERREEAIVMKQRKTSAKRIKDLSAKKVSAKTAKKVRGGALSSYLKLKGQKQGQFKG
jgi:hypothetical protein